MLRNYQHNIKHSLFAEWEQHRSVMVQMPTGTGKTHLLASVISDWLKEADHKSVWIVAHRRELVEQIEETVARYGIKPTNGFVKVRSIQWLYRHREDVKDERPSLIVIDEAHHALAETYKELWLRYPDAKKLGMTATSCRLNRKGFTDLFETLITSDSIADFIRQGWLSPFDYVSIRPNSEEQRLIDGLEKRGADGDFQVKEMDAVLNKRPTIERLYESARQYADGKKGIVYAISISHARNIAGYYTEHGLNAVAIDSKTPTKERKRLVDGFRLGKIQVLVNVDVFSEGFDCPDVEFIQLARPTLSIAKYVQQVGRGLRKTKGKESCVIIDNVGLYRLFGLPTACRDWQAMFEGRLAGKGVARAWRQADGYGCAVRSEADSEIMRQGSDLKVVMSHEKLLDCLNARTPLPECVASAALRPFKDRTTGLYGLRQGDKITAMPQYEEVFDVDGAVAVVRFEDKYVGIVNINGEVKAHLGRYAKARLLKDNILSVTDGNGQVTYIDLYNEQIYTKKPKPVAFGRVQLLEVDGVYYSRTKELYRTRRGTHVGDIFNYGFCVRICDYLANPICRQVDEDDARWGHACVCLFAGDHTAYYHYSGMLPGGGIVVMSGDGKYYLAEDGKEKRYIARENPRTEDENFDVVIPRLKAEAERTLAEQEAERRQEEEKKRRQRLEELKDAMPFKSGMKWGLRLGDKVVVPPVYRNMQMPVGYYCAVETSPYRWGVIMLDGKVVVEAGYSKVEIGRDGTAKLTIIPGMVRQVKLDT